MNILSVRFFSNTVTIVHSRGFSINVCRQGFNFSIYTGCLHVDMTFLPLRCVNTIWTFTHSHNINLTENHAALIRQSAGARSVVYLSNDPTKKKNKKNDPTLWLGLFFQFSQLNFQTALTKLITENDSNQYGVKSAVETLIQNSAFCIF